MGENCIYFLELFWKLCIKINNITFNIKIINTVNKYELVTIINSTIKEPVLNKPRL